MDRWRLLDPLALFGQGRFASLRGGLADGAILRLFATLFRPAREALDESADAFGDRQPREVEKQRKADRDRHQENHARTGKADAGPHPGRDGVADDSTGSAGKCNLQGIQAQRLEAGRRDDEQQEAGAMRPGGQIISQRVGSKRNAMQPAESARHRDQQTKGDQVRGRKADEQQHDVRQPRAKTPTDVVDRGGRDGVRETRVDTAIGQQHGQQRDGADGAHDPACLGKESRQPWVAGFGDRLPRPHPGAVGDGSGHAFNARA